MKKALIYAKARLLEASTWAGIAAIAVSVGTAFPAAAIPAHSVAVLAGCAAALIRERGAS